MKIGEFARKYDINVTAVRYYIEKALLAPERRNNQYVFDDSCMEDMEKILKYKKLRMSLEEIELLFFLEKTSNYRDETVLQMITELFMEKRRSLEEERESLNGIIEELDKEVQNLSDLKIPEKDTGNKGVPIAFSQYLYCPYCQKPLALEAASIISGQISGGRLYCDCGYEAVIENGIILCAGHMEETPFKVFDNVESIQSVADEYSDNYRMLVDKAYLWMYHRVSFLKDGRNSESRNIMAGPFTSNFILKYYKSFGKDTTIVVVDPSLKRISNLRKYMADRRFQVVYIAGDIDSIPLRENCIDMYIDDFSVTDSLFTYNQSIYSCIAFWLKTGGHAIGVFGDYADAPETLENFKKDHPDFLTAKMKLSTIEKEMSENHMHMKEKKDIGITSGRYRHFPRNVVGEQVTLLGYDAVKAD